MRTIRKRKRWKVYWSGLTGQYVLRDAHWGTFNDGDMVVADCWIPVNYAVPKQIKVDGELADPLVLIHAPRYPEQRVGRYITPLKQWRFAGSPTNFTDAVTMWTPFPEPPKRRAK